VIACSETKSDLTTTTAGAEKRYLTPRLPALFPGRSVLVLICAMFVSGCVHNLAGYAAPDAGVAIMSISAQKGNSFEDYDFTAYRTDVGPAINFHWVVGGIFAKPEADFDVPPRVGLVAVAKLPPGNYNLSLVSLVSFGKNYYISLRPSLPFTITAHEATYLGNFDGTMVYKPGLLGAPELFGSAFDVSDQRERDLAIARAKEPALESMQTDTPRWLRGKLHLEPVRR